MQVKNAHTPSKSAIQSSTFLTNIAYITSITYINSITYITCNTYIAIIDDVIMMYSKEWYT